MVELMEEDWDVFSPPGSPSFSLPQSIRDVLESVRAELGEDACGQAKGLDEPPAISLLNTRQEALVFGKQPEVISNVVEGSLGMPWGQESGNIDKVERLSSESHVVSKSNALQEKNTGLQQGALDQQIKVQSISKIHDHEETPNQLNVQDTPCISDLQQALAFPKVFSKDQKFSEDKKQHKLHGSIDVGNSSMNRSQQVSVRVPAKTRRPSHDRTWSIATQPVARPLHEISPANRSNKIFIMNPMSDACFPENRKNSRPDSGEDENSMEGSIKSEDGSCFFEPGIPDIETKRLVNGEPSKNSKSRICTMSDEQCLSDTSSPESEMNSELWIERRKPNKGFKARTGLKVLLPKSKKIKLENSIGDGGQEIEQARGTKERLDLGSETNPVAIWKQELLSSDFNLMYSCLRAILMGTISKNERSRLIETMLATMTELERVIMYGKNPLDQRLQCESPSPMEEEEKAELPRNAAREKVQDEKLDRAGNIGRDELKELRDREKFLNQKRLELLTKKNPDGTVTCLVCNLVREGASTTAQCKACISFAYRIEKAYSTGMPLPTCRHSEYSGGRKCKSCRYRKYTFMSMTSKHTRVREVSKKTCAVCQRTSSAFRNSWQCMKCHYFFKKLHRTPDRLPTCKHNGEFYLTCEGCKCYKTQVEWHMHESRPYPLPLVKKSLFNALVQVSN